MRRCALPLVLSVALAVAGCSDSAGPGAIPPAQAPGEAPAAVPPAQDAPSIDDAPGYATEARGADVTSTGPEPPILRDVRIAAHDGFDRIVFEFDSVGLPQWRVDFIEAPVIQCGSGHETPVAGTAWLQVRFSGANAHTAAGEGTSGPMRRTTDLQSVREVVRTCDFEAEVTWVAGLAAERGFRTDVLADPARLVIDIAHRETRPGK